MARQSYDWLIDNAKILPKWKSKLDAIQKFYNNNLERFDEAWAHTNVPSPIIAALNYRENGNNFDGHIHNGDPLSGKTFKVPANRPLKGNGPFTWLESVIDCLVNLKHMDRFPWGENTPDDLEKLESFNGWGYKNHGINSPYLFSGTDAYKKGYFVEDHVFDPEKVNAQLGIFPILLVLGYFEPV